jgi:ligand-binding sensor domain-containing protein
MTTRDYIDDPVFAKRVDGWLAEHRTLRAPERLVEAVMAEVVAAPRAKARPGWAWPIRPGAWQGIAAYGALTAVIAVGVTIGILFASIIGTGVGGPTIQPFTPSPSPSSTVGASLGGGPTVAPPEALVAAPDVQVAAVAIGASSDAVWAVDADRVLAELDPQSGSLLRSVVVPWPVDRLLVTTSAVWAASASGTLVRVDRASLAIDEVPGTPGVALASDGGDIWLGTTDGVVRIDAATLEVGLRAPVPDRGAELGIVAFGGSLWAATRTSIVRLDRTTGAVVGSINGDATALGSDGTSLWAMRGTELLRIDVAGEAATPILAGLTAASPTVFADGRLWVVGPPGGTNSTLRGVDLTAARIAYLGAIPVTARDLAIGGGYAWIAADDGSAIRRFVLPGAGG